MREICLTITVASVTVDRVRPHLTQLSLSEVFTARICSWVTSNWRQIVAFSLLCVCLKWNQAIKSWIKRTDTEQEREGADVPITQSILGHASDALQVICISDFHIFSSSSITRVFRYHLLSCLLLPLFLCMRRVSLESARREPFEKCSSLSSLIFALNDGETACVLYLKYSPRVHERGGDVLTQKQASYVNCTCTWSNQR